MTASKASASCKKGGADGPVTVRFAAVGRMKIETANADTRPSAREGFAPLHLSATAPKYLALYAPSPGFQGLLAIDASHQMLLAAPTPVLTVAVIGAGLRGGRRMLEAHRAIRSGTDRAFRSTADTR